jgi:hypothetical protein
LASLFGEYQTRHWRMAASLPIHSQPQALIRPIDHHGEFTLSVMVAVAIGMIWVHFAPVVSNVAFPNQWPRE